MESATQDPRTIYSLRLVALHESLLMSSRNSILPSTRKTVSRRKPSSRTRPAPRVSSFLMLPLEVLTEILPRLDWKSVLQLRQTCRYFYLVYKQHIIWTALVDRYIKSLPNPSRLDAPYSAYPPEELEKYFLRRLSAKNAWDSLTPHVRTVHCDMGSHLFHLLPGGRWLLVGQRSGEVVVYDLNSPAVAGFVIISADATLGEVLQMAVDVDYKSSFLSFRLVLCPNLEQTVSVPVYLVSLSDFPTISWSCYELRRLTASTAGIPTSVSIKGGVVAISIQRATNQGGDFVHIFSWEARSPPTAPQIIVSTAIYYGHLLRVNLLSESKIVIFTTDAIALHDVPPAEGFGGGVAQRELWSIGTPFKINGEGISPPFVCKGDTHFIMRAGPSVHGCTISKLDTAPGTLQINLFTYPFFCYEDIMCLGHHRAFARTSELDAVTIDFSCDGPGDPKAIPRDGTKVSWCPLDTCMDEESGRVVVCMRGKLTVYDFVHPQYL